jgi:hypothetical protein
MTRRAGCGGGTKREPTSVGSLWLKIKVWTKVVVFFGLLAYAVLFIVMNSTRTVTPWFWFGHAPETSVLILGLCAFFAGVIGTILLRTTFKTLRQIREMRERGRSDRLQREMEEMKAKAAKLRSRPTADPDAVTTEAQGERYSRRSNEGELP